MIIFLIGYQCMPSADLCSNEYIPQSLYSPFYAPATLSDLHIPTLDRAGEY